MRLTYDPRYNIAYIRFQEKRTGVETVRISDELVVDMAPDGIIYGIELLNANEQLQRDATGRLLIINEATGERAELPPFEPCRQVIALVEGHGQRSLRVQEARSERCP